MSVQRSAIPKTNSDVCVSPMNRIARPWNSGASGSSRSSVVGLQGEPDALEHLEEGLTASKVRSAGMAATSVCGVRV